MRAKYTNEYVLQTHTAQGWEDLTYHSTRKEAHAECRVYNANQPAPYRVIHRRIKVIETV